MYIQLRKELANGKTLLAPTYAEAMKQYIASKQREVDVNALTEKTTSTIVTKPHKAKSKKTTEKIAVNTPKVHGLKLFDCVVDV